MPYAFDLKFQEYILASFCGDRDFLATHMDVFVPEYFSDEVLRGIAESALEFFKEHKEVPTKEALLQEVKSQVAPGRTYGEYAEGVESVYEKMGENSGYYQGKAIAFARSQAIRNALRQSEYQLESGEIDGIARLVSDAAKLGDAPGTNIYNYLDGIRSRAERYSKNGHAENGRLPTGFYTLDEKMNGGLGVGELGVVVALPKTGKTSTLVNIGSSVLKKNKSVAYFTLELSKDVIASRFDTLLFGMNLQKIKKKVKTFYNSMMDLKKSVSSRLHIIEFPTNSMTVSKMEATLAKIGPVDVVIVDYGQLIRSSSKDTEMRHQLSHTYQELRRVAGEMKTRVWTAHQANRPGWGSKTLQSNNVAEDFNIVGIADFLMSFNQTEQEKRSNQARLYIMGSRIGSSGDTVHLDVDLETAVMTVSSDADQDKELE